MEFNYKKHRKLWYLLSKNIKSAIKDNYDGNGCYSGYSALEKLKRQLLAQYFGKEDNHIRNYCFACEAAYIEEQERDWKGKDGINCSYCPLHWPNEIPCDERQSLYIKLIDCLHANNVNDAAKLCVTIANIPPYSDEEYEKNINDHFYHDYKPELWL